MLKETLKWRANYKPEEIRWDEIAHEAETGKIYRSNYIDKCGRTVLVMRPSCQNSKSTKGQIRYLVYCMENAILNLSPDQEQMVWLIDFQGFNLSHISLKVVKPFLEPKTQNKVKFVYSDDLNTVKIMEDLFVMDQLESAFGGKDSSGFNINKYAERMREDDKRMPSFWATETPPSVAPQPALTSGCTSGFS
ncbi:Random slug 5 [Melia azedarach]|uniref:Random slug 5 n=1 Tax=Melia azedarach TaxID=155640 RepID=A0ACC1WQJ2_MELAZ|nr:Random slug 5 [Melia azedarach]